MRSVDSQVQLIGDVAAPHGLTSIQVEGPALVTGLADTGADAAPSPQRAALMADMLARGVNNPNGILASPSTSLVWARAYLPPAVQKGDRLDLEVRVPAQVETSSLQGGWMLQARLKEMVVVGAQLHEGDVMVIGQGPLLVDPVMKGEQDSVKLKQAKVLGGGVAMRSRTLGLVLKPDAKSIAVSKQIGDALNRRFHTFAQGTNRGVATPKTHEFVELELHPRYKQNIARYLRVVRSVALHETAGQQQVRLSLLEQQLLDPVTAATAALRLEAIGKEAIPVLRKGIAHEDPEVRFYSAEALAYLDDSQAAAPLAQAARDEPAFRAYALTALGSLDDINSSDQLEALLEVSSAETRYGAFRALWSMNKTKPLVRGEYLGEKVHYHVLPCNGPSMIHVAHSQRPEIVLFGANQKFSGPLVAEAGRSIVVRSLDSHQIAISKFAVGQADQRRVVPNSVDAVIRAVIDMGGDYPDVVQLLQSARASRALDSRLEVDALPRGGRSYERSGATEGEPLAADSESTGSRWEVANPLPNLFGSSRTTTR